MTDLAVVKRAAERFEKTDPALTSGASGTTGDILGELVDFPGGDDPHDERNGVELSASFPLEFTTTLDADVRVSVTEELSVDTVSFFDSEGMSFE